MSGVEDAKHVPLKTSKVGEIKMLYFKLQQLYNLNVANTYAVRPQKLGLVERLFKAHLNSKCAFFLFGNPQKTNKREGQLV